MAKKKFTQLTVADALTGDEILAVVQSETSKQTTIQDVVALVTGINEVGFTDLGTGSGTLDLNFGDAWIGFFRGQTSFGTAKNVTISSASNAFQFHFSFEISNVAATLTFPVGYTGDFSDPRWDTDNRRWTADSIGKYKVVGTYDGAEWKVEFSTGPFV